MLNPDGLDCHLFISNLAELNLPERFVCLIHKCLMHMRFFEGGWHISIFIFRKSFGRLKSCSIKQCFVQYGHDMHRQVRDSSTSGRGSDLVFAVFVCF